MTIPGKLRDGRLSSANRFSANDSAMGNTQYGFGLFLDNSTNDKTLIVQHNGGINGFASYLATHVPSNLTVACLCNVDMHPDLPFREIRRTVFQELLQSGKV
jgi:D-alanyl-D-alanine carboxypeptidase